jgi:hypothetical protein
MKTSVKKRGGVAGGPGRIPDPRKLGCAHKGLGSRMCARVGWVGWVGGGWGGCGVGGWVRREGVHNCEHADAQGDAAMVR